MNKYLKYLSILMLINTFSCANDSDQKIKAFYKFPDNFLWGTATASYQIEGGITNDWSTSSLDAGKAANSYEKYHEDAKIAKSLKNNSYRLSIEWARIEPEPNKFDLKAVEHYRKVLINLREQGLTPLVTLHHFTNPVWIAKMGGWENEKVIAEFVNYVRFIVEKLQDLVDIWITVNEPNVYAFKAYDEGSFPPYKKDRKSALRVMANLIKAHGKAYRVIHQIDKISVDKNIQNPMVGFAQHIALFEPHNWINPIDQIMTYFVNRVFNNAFWQTIDTGEVKINIPGVDGVNEAFDPDLKDSMDFVAFNYYTRWFIYSDGSQKANQNVELTDMGWEIYPEGMLTAIKMANKYAVKRNLPIYITENGIDDEKDTKRAFYLVSHIEKIAEAIKQGINVKGYMYWSLIDNYEWADKFRPKFGLMSIDRKIRPSAQIYKEICENNGITTNLLNKPLNKK